MAYEKIITLYVSVFCIGILYVQKLPHIKSTRFKKESMSILKFGAIADELRLKIKSINAVIVSCSEKVGGDWTNNIQ